MQIPGKSAWISSLHRICLNRIIVSRAGFGYRVGAGVGVGVVASAVILGFSWALSATVSATTASKASASTLSVLVIISSRSWFNWLWRSFSRKGLWIDHRNNSLVAAVKKRPGRCKYRHIRMFGSECTYPTAIAANSSLYTAGVIRKHFAAES